MELKLGSIWLLLSCSLQQSLLGILASVPRTAAKKCTEQLSSDGERSTVRKVQMIRRIPARCSGWDEAWSWITKIDCRTKYVLDYVELPFDVKKTDSKDCDTAEAEAAESSDFDITDEKFLAIVFGSGGIALLILIVIIVILVKKGRPRCGRMCGRPTDYTAANANDNEVHGDQHNCNEYVDEGLKLAEPEYEEIRDPNAKEKLLNYPHEMITDTEPKSIRYQNVPDPVNGANVLNGVFSRTVVPSAPYEEEINQQTAVKDVEEVSDSDTGKNYESKSVLETDVKCKSAQLDTKVKEIDELKPNEEEKCKDIADDDKDKKEKNEETHPKTQNFYSEFEDLVTSRRTASDTACDDLVKAHSYENLDPDNMVKSVTPNYECLVQSVLGDHPGINCSKDKDVGIESEEIDSDLLMQNLKDISPSDSPIQSEDVC